MEMEVYKTKESKALSTKISYIIDIIMRWPRLNGERGRHYRGSFFYVLGVM